MEFERMIKSYNHNIIVQLKAIENSKTWNISDLEDVNRRQFEFLERQRARLKEAEDKLAELRAAEAVAEAGDVVAETRDQV